MTDDPVTRIACVQMEPIVGEVAANVERTIEFASQCADRGARVVVLPELVSSGYAFRSTEEAHALAETVSSGSSVAQWETLARRRKIYLVAGMPEKEGPVLFNTALLFGPDGLIGLYRKLHLWDQEQRVFAPGNRGLPVFETPLGRIGLCICYDAWFPETFRLLALHGADLVCMPANWVEPEKRAPQPPGSSFPMRTMLLLTAAHINSIFIAAAGRTGRERGCQFEGSSVIVGSAGWPEAGPASYDGEEIIFADVPLGKAPRARRWTLTNHILDDRRVDVFDRPGGSAWPPGST